MGDNFFKYILIGILAFAFGVFSSAIIYSGSVCQQLKGNYVECEKTIYKIEKLQ